MKVAKKKKKSSPFKNKQKAAEFKNDYLRRMKALMDEKLGPGSYAQLTSIEKTALFALRVQSPKLEFVNADDMSGRWRKLLKKFLNYYLKTTESDVPYKDRNLYLDEYLSIWHTLFSFFPRVGAGNESDERMYKLGRRFLDHALDEEQENGSLITLSLKLLELSRLFSYPGVTLNLRYELYSVPIPDTDSKLFKQRVHVEIHAAPWKLFIIDRQKHKAYKFGLNSINNKFEWIQIASKHLGGTNAFADLPIEIYWQAHADIRLTERMNGVNLSYAMGFLYSSFKEPEVVPADNDTFLIAYNLGEQKVGYFVGTLIDGILLIRTFLFLTNTGTPEGNALNAKLNLMKADKQYLMIDRLNAYISMDEKTKEELRPYFKGTGCEHLLDLNLALFNLSALEKRMDTLQFSMEDYLNIDDREEKLENMIE